MARFVAVGGVRYVGVDGARRAAQKRALVVMLCVVARQAPALLDADGRVPRVDGAGARGAIRAGGIAQRRLVLRSQARGLASAHLQESSAVVCGPVCVVVVVDAVDGRVVATRLRIQQRRYVGLLQTLAPRHASRRSGSVHGADERLEVGQ